MSTPHALCSPSSADRWLMCPGSVAMERGEPDTTSAASAEGTLAHTHAAQWLMSGDATSDLQDDPEMFEAVYTYVEHVLDVYSRLIDSGAAVEMLVEVPLPLQDVTSEAGAQGTADCILIARWSSHAALYVFDLKYGRGVEVDDDTPQLKIYALAALMKYGLLDDFGSVFTSVVQPRMRAPGEPIEHKVAELLKFSAAVYDSARLSLSLIDKPATAATFLHVSEKGCRFCKAQHKCPAKTKQVHDTVYGEIQDITADELVPVDADTFTGSVADYTALLPLFMSRVREIEQWCSAVRARTEQVLLAGGEVPGWKLVTGRMGARRWVNPSVVLPMATAAGVPQESVMTEPEVRTPADIEKRIKRDHPAVWIALQALITQEPGKPSVAPADDPRPSYVGASVDAIEDYSSSGLV